MISPTFSMTQDAGGMLAAVSDSNCGSPADPGRGIVSFLAFVLKPSETE